MPIIDYDPMMAMDQNLTSTTLQDVMQRYYAQQSSTSTNNNAQQETLEWAKFAMWLRGFLGALEGKQLTSEDVGKIMEKLATVDPDSQNRRYEQFAYPHYNPPVQPAIPTYTTPSLPSVPLWVYKPSITTSDGTTSEETVKYLADCAKLGSSDAR